MIATFVRSQPYARSRLAFSVLRTVLGGLFFLALGQPIVGEDCGHSTTVLCATVVIWSASSQPSDHGGTGHLGLRTESFAQSERSHGTRFECLRRSENCRIGGSDFNAEPRNDGKGLAFERMTVLGSDCPVPAWSWTVGRAAHTARLFHFSEWICSSQNFNDRRARAAKRKGQGSGETTRP